MRAGRPGGGRASRAASRGFGVVERRTARSLEHLRLAGWRIYHRFPFEDREIDHVLVGPQGVLVVETAWRARGVRRNTAGAADDVERALESARKMRLFLRSVRALTAVSPVLVMHGRATATPFEGTGVTIVPADRVKRWAGTVRQRPSVLDRDGMDAIALAMDLYLARYDAQRARGVPRRIVLESATP